MSRSRPKTRRHPRSNPRGVLRIMSGGFGFVQTAEGECFVPASKMGGAFDGDLVELAIISVNKEHKQPQKQNGKTGEKPTARVVRIINRAHDTLIGRYEIAEPFGVVIPEDKRIPYDIFTMHAENPSVCDGDFVRVRIVEYPTRNTAATGVIEEVVGHEGDELLAVEMIIARHKLETRFSDAALAQAQEVSLEVSRALSEGYRDLRDREIFTVDPVDARDFDDALSIDYVEGLWRLGVHIADVSHYVPWNSPLDIDARKRATSVYLVDRVIPMIPEQLSADICSLKPHEDRLTMTVDLYLDDRFNVNRYDIYPAVIRSCARFNYDEVQGFLEGNTAPQGFVDRFNQLHAIEQGLADKRRLAGGIDFMTTEAKVRLDESGKPVEIVLRKKTDATSIIEEAMILANKTVAEHLALKGFPCMYRVHEKPSVDNLAELMPILREFDYLKDVSTADFVAGNPFCVQEVLSLCKGKPEEELISSLILRAMKRAVYQPECDIHYGLALDKYCHFTSPIRRYPDLIVHRMLKAELFGRSGTFEQEVNSLDRLAKRSSEAERIAEAAARESQEVKIVEYLQDDLGCVFDAVIAGVTSYGLFVRLHNTAEGLVSLKNLGKEYFAYDNKRHTLTGEESNKVFRLGQKVRVVLDAADPRLGRLDFHILDSRAI